jgi:hypothetical protein
MSTAPSIGIPELAGICTYETAAEVGFSVEESVRRLVRLHWTHKRLLEACVSHLPAAPEWEIKSALALHLWQDAEHAEAIRGRTTEMRSPPPRLDVAPDDALDAWLEEQLRAEGSLELVVGLYGVARPALIDAYRRYLDGSNPLVDHPTRRLIRYALLEQEDAAAWGARALGALVGADEEARSRADAWAEHLRAYLAAAGGVDGADQPAAQPELPPARAAEPLAPDTTPRRDPRFHGTHDFDFPPQLVYNMEGVPADERNLALICRRALEMDVPEVMASFLAERHDQPWEFYRDYARQLWDEARHAMMGTVALEARGIDWTRIPLHVGFALRLNRHAEPVERQLLLFAIEQSLMPGDTGKRFEYETALEAGDPLSAHFQDFDWADEVLHAQIGRRWIKREGYTVEEALEAAQAVHERTWGALDRYRSGAGWKESFGWWRDFVRQELGKPSAATDPVEGPPRLIAD